MKIANIENFSAYLKSLGACSVAVDWAKGKSLKTAWNTVNQADWMMWLLGKNVDAEGWPSRETVVLLSCAIARKVLKYVPEGEDRPRLAIEAAEKWAAGKETLENVEDAAVSAYAAYSAAAWTASYTASSASSAANASAEREEFNKGVCNLVRKKIKII